MAVDDHRRREIKQAIGFGTGRAATLTPVLYLRVQNGNDRCLTRLDRLSLKRWPQMDMQVPLTLLTRS